MSFQWPPSFSPKRRNECAITMKYMNFCLIAVRYIDTIQTIYCNCIEHSHKDIVSCSEYLLSFKPKNRNRGVF